MSDAEWKAAQGQKIEKIYIWVAEEADGGEGIVATFLTDLGWVPLVGADRARMEGHRADAMAAGEATGRPVRLKLFSGGTVIDSIP